MVENRLEELKQDYGNMTQNNLEEKYGASYSTISLVLHKHGLMLNRQNPAKYKYFREHEKEFIKDWTEGILSKNELEEKYQCPYGTMSTYSSNVQIYRKTTENRRLGMELYNKN